MFELSQRPRRLEALAAIPWLKLLVLTFAFLTLDLQPATCQGNLSRVLVWKESVAGDSDHKLRWPSAVAVASDGGFAVADNFGDRLLVFEKVDGVWSVRSSIELSGPPAGLAWLGGRYVLSIRGKDTLLSLDDQGLEESQIPLPPGVAAGPICSKMDDSLVVVSVRQGKILEIDSGGRVLAEIEVPYTVADLACPVSGGVFAVLPAEGIVVRYDSNWGQIDTWELPQNDSIPPWPVGIAVDPGGTAFVVDKHGNRVVLLDPQGAIQGFGSRGGSEPGLLRFPSGIATFSNGQIIVLDQGNARVQIFEKSN